MDRIDPVIQAYPAGTPLVRADEPVTPQTLLFLQAHAEQLLEEKDLNERRLEAVGQSIMLLAALIATAILLRLIQPNLICQSDRIGLLALLSLFTLGFARLLTYLSLQTTLVPTSSLIYLVPHAFAVLMAAILINGGAALALGFCVALQPQSTSTNPLVSLFSDLYHGHSDHRRTKRSPPL